MKHRVLITNDRATEHIGQIQGYMEHKEFARASTDNCVRVTNIGAKWWVRHGDDVLVFVTVCNDGACRETFDLTLEDTTRKVVIDNRTVTLLSRASEVVTFKWKTEGFSLGEHVLYAKVTPSSVALDEANQILQMLQRRWEGAKSARVEAERHREQAEAEATERTDDLPA